MHRAMGSVLARILLIAAVLLVAGSAHAPAETQSASASPPSGVSAAQAHDLLTVLNDPARRAQLIQQLQTLEKTAPSAPAPSSTEAAPNASAPAAAPNGATPKGPAPAGTPASNPAPAPATSHAVTSSGLLSQLVRAAPAWAYTAFSQFASLRHVLRGIPASGRWLAQTANDPSAQQYLLNAGLGLVTVLVPAFVAWFALRRLLRPRRARLDRLAGDGHLAEAPSATRRSPLNARVAGSARRLGLALLAFVLDAAPIAAFAGVAYLLATIVPAAAATAMLVLGVVDAVVIYASVLCVARLLFAPDLPALRLVPVSSASASTWMRWIAWLEGIAVFGMAILNMALLLGLDPRAQVALKKLVLLIDHVLLVVLVLRSRQAVARHLRAPRRQRGLFAGVLTGLAEVWHIIAVVVIMGLWLIWAADWQGGYTRLGEFILAAIAVGIVTRVLTAGLLISVRHSLGMDEETGNGAATPAQAFAMRSRAARYYPMISASIGGIMTLIGIIVWLELLGVSSVGWLLGSALGQQAISAAVSILITLCIAAVAWEAINVSMDRHLDRLSHQTQIARAARLRTLLPMLRAAVAITILTIVGLTTLSQIGINIAPLLAGAGIVGVAIGFGSQKLVQDLITGVFLLLEDAMQVGDWVTLAGVSGSVEKLSVRTIRLRAGDGSLHIIPFSSVTTVNNTNRGLGNAAINVTVAADQDPDAVAEVLKAIVTEMRDDPMFKPMILGDLQYWGVDKVDGSSMLLVGQIPCTDAGRWGVQREFNRRYRKRFREIGIEIPNPTQTLLLRGDAIRPPAAAPRKPAKASEEAGDSAATVAASPPTAPQNAAVAADAHR